MILLIVVAHAAVGALAAKVTGNPLASFGLGLGTHIVLDIIPHADYQKTICGVLDLAAALCFLGAAIGSGIGSAPLIAGAIGGILPDLEVALSRLTDGRIKLWFPTHSGLIPHGRLDGPLGVLVQAFVIVLALGALLAL